MFALVKLSKRYKDIANIENMNFHYFILQEYTVQDGLSAKRVKKMMKAKE